MGKLLIVATIGIASLKVFGQGQVVMCTYAANNYVKFSNAVAATFYAGDQVYVGLYWAADAATLANGGGSLATSADMLNGPAGTNATGLAILSGNGLVYCSKFGGNRYIPGRAGVTTYFQLRAWTNPQRIKAKGSSFPRGR